MKHTSFYLYILRKIYVKEYTVKYPTKITITKLYNLILWNLLSRFWSFKDWSFIFNSKMYEMSPDVLMCASAYVCVIHRDSEELNEILNNYTI